MKQEVSGDWCGLEFKDEPAENIRLREYDPKLKVKLRVY